MLSVDAVLLDHRLSGLLTYCSEEAAGIDLRASSVSVRGEPFVALVKGSPFTLYPGEQCKIGSGLKLHLSTAFGESAMANLAEGLTVAGMLLPRSGLGAKYRLRLSNTIGLIDADYQGEIVMVMENGGTEPFDIMALDRMAQLVVVPVLRILPNIVSEFVSETERGANGFGSTGHK